MAYFIVKQLPCPHPNGFNATPLWSDDELSIFVRPRVPKLTYTSNRIRSYAVDVVGGKPGAPFRWITDRRAQLMAELDAAMLHLHGLKRDDAEHVLDSFPVVRKYDERDCGEFRMERLVLTEYDAMSRAAGTGIPYRSPLSPPPGEGSRHEKASE